MELSEIIEGTAVSATVSAILSAFLGNYIGIIASLLFFALGIIGIVKGIGEIMSGMIIGGVITLVFNLAFLGI